MTIRVELFTGDPDRSAAFYERVLGFTIDERHESGSGLYVAVRRGAVRIGIGRTDQVIAKEARSVPTGTEIVLEVEDVHQELASVLAAGWPLAAGLCRRPWGLEDFRLFDPDGYYLRVTARE